MGYRFKGLPVKDVGGYTLPDDDALTNLPIDRRLATPAFPEDIGTMPDETARLVKGTVVEVREVVAAGEPGAGPVDEANVVVTWNDGARAMSFSQPQFDALFEEV